MIMTENMFGSDSRNSVAIPHGGTWVADTMGDEGKTYLISVSRNGDHMGWKVGKLSAVLNTISDQAYAEAIGEDSDTVTVFVLTECGPVPVRIVSKRHEGPGFIEHTVRWLDPLRSAREQRNAWPHETGYTKIIDI